MKTSNPIRPFVLVLLLAGSLCAQQGVNVTKVGNVAVSLYDTIFNATSATATQTSSAVRVPGFSGYGAFSVVFAGLTGSPAGCQFAFEYQQNTGTAASAAFFTQAVTPSSSYQSFTVSPAAGFNAGDNVIVVYSCGTYPTAGTMTVTYNPTGQGPIPAGSSVIGHVITDSGSVAAVTKTDGSDVTLGAKGDAKNAATDTTAISAMQVLKEISFLLQSAIPAGTNVIGHVVADSGSTTAVTGNVATTKADGSDVTLGSKADAKSTATDTTAVTIMQVLKEISALEQAPASRAVTNAGTFTVQESTLDAAISGNKVAVKTADGDQVTIGTKTDAAATQTDATAVSVISLLKELSAKAQSPAALPNNQSANVNQVAGTSLGPTAVVNYGSTPAAVAVPAVNAFVTNVNANGQGTMANSAPVALASNQSAEAAWGQGATGSAVPTGAQYVGGNGSGNLTGIVACDNSTAVNMVTATTTQIVAISGTAGRTYICSINLVAAGADNVALVSGSGTNCASNLAGLAGGTTAGTGWNFAANGGLTQGSGLGMIYKTVTTNNEICLVTSAAVQLSGTITWTQF